MSTPPDNPDFEAQKRGAQSDAPPYGVSVNAVGSPGYSFQRLKETTALKLEGTTGSRKRKTKKNGNPKKTHRLTLETIYIRYMKFPGIFGVIISKCYTLMVTNSKKC